MNNGDQQGESLWLPPESKAMKYGRTANQAEIHDAIRNLFRRDTNGMGSREFTLMRRVATRICLREGLTHVSADDLIQIVFRSLLDGTRKWYCDHQPRFAGAVISILKFAAFDERRKDRLRVGHFAFLELDEEMMDRRQMDSDDGHDKPADFEDPAILWERKEEEAALRDEMLELVREDPVCSRIVAYCLDNPCSPSNSGMMMLKRHEICEALNLPEAELNNAIKRLKRIYGACPSGGASPRR